MESEIAASLEAISGTLTTISYTLGAFVGFYIMWSIVFPRK